MSFTYTTQPQQNSIKNQRGNFRLANLKKELGLINHAARLKTISNQQKQLLFVNNYSQIGNPQNKYLIEKVKKFVNRIGNVSRRMTRTEDKVTKQSSFRSSTQVQQQLTVYSYRNANNNSKPSYQKAYMLNQSQKIQRLIAKRQQQIEGYKSIQDQIKIKLSPKKSKISEFTTLRPINQITWYKKWNKNDAGQKSRKQMKILKKLQSYQSRRFHTQGVLSTYKLDRSLQF